MTTSTMVLRISSVAIIAGFIFACSSNPKTSLDKEVQPDLKDYVVRDRYPAEAPAWLRNFSGFKLKNEGRGLNYFMGESGDVSDRIAGCDLAALFAKKKISQQIAEFITNKIAVSKIGQLLIDKDQSGANKLGDNFTDTVAGKSVAFLSGVKEFDQAWEERDYSASNGQKRVYQCNVVVTIDDKSLAEAVKKVASKAIETVDDQEAKSQVKEILKDIDIEFKTYI